MADLRLQILLGTIDKATAPMRKVMGAGKGLAETMQQSQAALKRLDQQQRRLQGFATLKNKTDASRIAMRAAAQNVRTLSAQMAAMESPTKRASDKLKSAHQSNLAALRASRQGLKDSGIGARDFGNAQRRLQSEIAATTAKITQQQGRLDAWNASQERARQIKQRVQSMHESGKGILQKGLGAYYGGRQAVETGKELESLGVSTKDENGNLRNIVDLIAQIDAAFTRRDDGSAERLAWSDYSGPQPAEEREWVDSSAVGRELI